MKEPREEATVREPLNVFISYAPEDEPRLAELNQHLVVLEQQGEIRLWHRQKIVAGADWQGQIDEQLEIADLILVLISSAFLASEERFDDEARRILDRHTRGEARVIPIIARHCDWRHSRFGALQPLPKNGKPVTAASHRDQAWVDVVEGLRRSIEQLRNNQPPAEPTLDASPREARGAASGTSLESGSPDGFDPLLELDELQLGELLVSSGWLSRNEVRSADEQRRSVLPSSFDPEDLSQVGWGAIFPSGRASELRKRLAPLLRHRERQARSHFKTYEVSSHQPARRFLAEHNVTPGSMVVPDQLPYYLLLVGGPTEISFDFQYHLNIHRAVGRLAFDRPEDYQSYAEALVEVELNGSNRRRQMTLFSVNNQDTATQRLAKHFVQPMAEKLPGRVKGWPVEVHSGEQATKAALEKLFDDAPSFLVTGSHGRPMPSGSLHQVERQGALVCQDWQKGDVFREEFCFHGADLPGDVRLHGMVAFLAACYGAGTPLEDNFPHYQPESQITEKIEPRELAPDPFVARLPQALLRQGASAVIGHVDRLWTSSFCWQNGEEAVTTSAFLEEAFANLLAGQRIGHALRPLADRSSRVAEQLTEPLKWLRDERPVDESHLARLWTLHNDARNMIVLGDPAAQISSEGDSDEARHVSPVVELAKDQVADQVAEAVVPANEVPASRGPSDGDMPLHAPSNSGAEHSLRMIVTEKTSVEGTRLGFQVEVLPELEGFGSFEPFESRVLRQTPIDYFKDFFRDIESMSGPNVEEMLASYGVELWEELIPENLRARLWEIRDRIGALHIVSYESWIPWELMKLVSADGQSIDDRFLAERYVLTRWLSIERNSPTPNMAIDRVAAVFPVDSGLKWSRQEREMLEAFDSPDRKVVPITPARFSQVVETLGTGVYDAWHFSGHGSAWSGGSRRWSIALEGGEALTAEHLNNRARGLGKARPLIFVNTCSSAPGEIRLTCIGGLVAGFLKQGAGAYLGTHWEVPDRQAAFFAEAFYRIYLRGQTTVGEAVRRARLEMREEFPNDPTWLAYTAFCHPLAVCSESLLEVPPRPETWAPLTESASLESPYVVDPEKRKSESSLNRGTASPAEGETTRRSGAISPESAASKAAKPKRSGRRLTLATLGLLTVIALSTALWTWRGAQQKRDALALNNQGVELLRDREFEPARGKFESALELDPELAQAMVNLAEVEEEVENWPAAVAGYRSALALQPDNAVFRRNFGSLLLKSGNTLEAKTELERAIELDPKYAEAFNDLGNLYLDQQRIPDARKVLEAGVEADPDFAPLHKNLARALIEAGNAASAIPHLREALARYEQNTDRREAIWWMAKAHAQIQDAPAVCKSVQDYSSIHGSEFSTWMPDIRELAAQHDCQLVHPAPP